MSVLKDSLLSKKTISMLSRWCVHDFFPLLADAMTRRVMSNETKIYRHKKAEKPDEWMKLCVEFVDIFMVASSSYPPPDISSDSIEWNNYPTRFSRYGPFLPKPVKDLRTEICRGCPDLTCSFLKSKLTVFIHEFQQKVNSSRSMYPKKRVGKEKEKLLLK